MPRSCTEKVVKAASTEGEIHQSNACPVPGTTLQLSCSHLHRSEQL